MKLVPPRSPFVMTGLDPVIHAAPFRMSLALSRLRDRVDGRVKHGHDENGERDGLA
jgi:hypothetical protein